MTAEPTETVKSEPSRLARGPATMTARPSLTASTLAIVAAATVVVLLGVSLVPVVALELTGLLAVAGGLSLYRRDRSMVGGTLAVVGISGCVAALGLAVTQTDGLGELLWVLPGVTGVVLLGLGVIPLSGSGTRWLVKAGAGGVFLAVGIAGFFQYAPLGTLLIAMAGTVLAWDAGEHAIDVGRQLGRSASTWRLDVTHVGSTALVGVLGVLGGHSVAGMQGGQLSLSAFALLVLALVGLTLALHR